MFNDLRFALRILGKNPGFTAVVVLTLALGIAGNTTIFSFVSTLLLQPPPVEAPRELWQILRLNPKLGSVFGGYDVLNYPGYTYFRDHNETFTQFGAFDPETPFVSWNRDGLGQPAQCQFVSGNFFDLCGVKMALGRSFSPEEDRAPGTQPVTVVSHAFWRARLRADPQVIGHDLTINGVNLTVIGVARSGFIGTMAGLAPDLWAPFAMAPLVLHDPDWLTRKGSFSLIALGRLKSGLNAAQAEADLNVLIRRYGEIDPQYYKDVKAALVPTTMVPAPFRGFVRVFTGILMGAVFLVLLIACANAASLLLTRGTSRRQEMAVRASLGAARRRLIRQLLTESVLISLLGGALGLLLTTWLMPLMLRLIPPTLPIRLTVELDWRVLSFTVLVSILTGILFGLAPALICTRLNLASALKDESPTGAGRRSRLAGALIAAQVAICLVLLIAGTLCLRSLFNAQSLNPGFQVHDRVVAEANLNDYGYNESQVKDFYARFVQRTRALPGVKSAAVASYLPLAAAETATLFNVEGQQPPQGQEGFVMQIFDIGPGYFGTMGTVVLRGREFSERDREDSLPLAVINEEMANRFWPGQNPVGQRLIEGKLGQGTSYEIVGVVQTGKYRTLGEDSRPIVFRSYLQHWHARSTLVVHFQGHSQPVLAAIRGVAQELEPRLALTQLMTLEQHLALALFPVRTTGLLLGTLGLVALLLAVSGLFGVIAYSVSHRTREIGIRMALGAQRNDVLRLELRHAMILTAAGIAVGLVGAFALTRLLESLLFGVSPTDPVTFTAIALLLSAVALLACYIPARTATKVDPMVALRYE